MLNTTMYNRLKDENSLYLKQHKDNPIFWWPYGPEAIQKAKDENKPIFMSIGYSSCHWCHVMAAESFEDQDIADFLNENFIPIKVDKEEFPDIDQYYQQACQLFTRTGGWPLSSFMLPDMRPFFVGTYFPKKGSEGLPSFKDILKELHRAYQEDFKRIEKEASEATDTLSKSMIPKEKVEFQGHFPPPSAILEALEKFQDKENGGYGQAPKFPQFSFYEWAIEQMLEGMIDQKQGEHIIMSLEKMLMGGVMDHVRGGIHRYATQANWDHPHYEKMLYDQAGLLSLLTKLSLIYPSPLVYDHLIKTLEYLETEMLGDDKYFFASQNADSEGVEGLYFTFSEEEFEDVVNQTLEHNENLDSTFKLEQIKSWFNIKGPNLHTISLNHQLKNEIFTVKAWEVIREVKKNLLSKRKERIPPSTDNKGVASWNFLIVSSLIDVMQYCKIDVIRQQASRLFNTSLDGLYNHFLVKGEHNKMGLRHSTTKQSGLPYLEDFVFFSETQLRVYEITGNSIFKKNFQDTLEFIYKEFIEQNKIKTRAITANDFELYPNIESSPFESSFKSPAATLLHLTRRANLLFPKEEWSIRFKDISEKMINDVLKNPLSSGQGLRSFTYPDDSYRVIKVPKTWLNQTSFLEFIPYFMSRFVLDYHEDKNEDWQVCNSKACELQGTGLESFIKTLSPASPKGKSEGEDQTQDQDKKQDGV